MNSTEYSIQYEWMRSIRKLLRNVAIGIMSWWLCMHHAMATSEMPIALDIKQVDGKPVACLPMNDDRAEDEIQVRMVGVARSTGPASPDITYWWFELPATAKPVYLKRGECLVYGQAVEGSIVHTPPKALDVDYAYYISLIPGGKYGPVYSAGFCVLKQSDGGTRIAVPGKDQNSCASIGY
jgi:hypothetical protein